MSNRVVVNFVPASLTLSLAGVPATATFTTFGPVNHFGLFFLGFGDQQIISTVGVGQPFSQFDVSDLAGRTVSPQGLDSTALVIGAEPSPPEVVDRWAPGRVMINAYGPTETMICASISAPLAAGPGRTTSRSRQDGGGDELRGDLSCVPRGRSSRCLGYHRRKPARRDTHVDPLEFGRSALLAKSGQTTQGGHRPVLFGHH